MIARFLRFLLGQPPLFRVWHLPRAPWGDWIQELTSSRDVAHDMVAGYRREGAMSYYERVR